MDWILVEGVLPSDGRRGFASFALDAEPGDAPDAALVALPSGLVHEIVGLGGAINVGADQGLTVRHLGWFEGTWRMAWRSWRTWMRLAAEQRRVSGLTLLRMLVDLPGAYRAATSFRGMGYRDWLTVVDELGEIGRSLVRARIASLSAAQRFHVCIVGADVVGRAATKASLEAQLHGNFLIVDPVADTDLAGAWLVVLHVGDRLAEHALYWFACEALAHPDAVMIYADDDELDAEGRRCRPRFKPDWSLAHLRSTDYIGRAVALRGDAVQAAGGLSGAVSDGGFYDLLLRVAEQAGDRVVHIPAVLLHRRTGDARSREDDEQEAASVRAHLARMDIRAAVATTIPACRRVRFDLPSPPPLASIVIPTRDAEPLLRQCVESVLAKTTYPRFELVVVDNGSRDPAALAYLAELAVRPGVRVLRWDRPFNFSAINNFAVREARGEVLCLLNNDTEVISPEWLDEMVGHLAQDRVGVVGAKLYYPDGRVQHGGDTVGPGGCANHLHQFLAHDDPGYCNRAAVAQELSAVTAACMVTWRALYLELGGLDEKHLPVAFNDVDYCLRVRQAGRRVVWTPHAELVHHESVSRGADRSLARRIRAWREVRFMRKKWHKEMQNDPFYNPNFSYLRPDFALGRAPRVRKPWLDQP